MAKSFQEIAVNTKIKLHVWGEDLESLLQISCKLDDLEPKLVQAINYAVFPGGKRLRPMLLCAVADDLGIEVSSVLPAAAAIELLHCASLVHDDLPALDNDSMRRGKPSCHAAFGEAIAVLAGDALISQAFAVLSQAKFPGAVFPELVKEFAQTFTTICSGQSRDVDQTKSEYTEPSHKLLYHEKTAVLFRLTFISALLAKYPKGPIFTSLETLGLEIGLTFQLLDDYLDLYGSDAQRGRVGSSDQRNLKENYFIKIPPEEAKNQARDFRLGLDRKISQTEELLKRQSQPINFKGLISTRQVLALGFSSDIMQEY